MVDVLLCTADAGRGGVGLQELELGRERVVGPGFVLLLVAAALAITVVAGAGLGAALPVVLRRLRLDPAIASGPLLGSAMDIVSLTVYVTLVLLFSRVIA